MRKPKISSSDQVVERTQKKLRRLSYSSIRLYSVSNSTRYINTTNATNIKARCIEKSRVCNIAILSKQYDAVSQTIKSMHLKEINRVPEMDICLEFRLFGANVGEIYLATYTYVVQIEKKCFELPEDDKTTALIKNIVKNKWG